MEAYLKDLFEKMLAQNNKVFVSILQDIRKSNKVKEVTIVHKGKRYVSKTTAAFLLDVSESWIDKKVLEGKLQKRFLDGNKTPRFLDSEVLELITTEPNEAETRKPRRNAKKRGIMEQL